MKSADSSQIGMLRIMLGDFLIALLLVFTVYLSINMVHRIHTVVLKEIYIKVFIYELLLCGILLVCAVDLRTGFLTCIRFLPAKVIGWIVRLLMISAAVCVLGIVNNVVASGINRHPADADNVLVLGMALQNGHPTKDLLLRLDTAKLYAEQHPEAKLILTGGNPDETGKTEAAVMRDLLVEDGFPEERLILEDKAADTEQNFVNTAKLIDPSAPVLVVSSDYHMGRALRMAEEAGFEHADRLPAPSDPLQYGTNIMWEVILKLNQYMPKRQAQ